MDNNETSWSALKKDKVLRVLLKNQLPVLQKTEDLFPEIIDTIIGQQLSNGPAKIISDRFWKLFKKGRQATPSEILKISDEKIRNCGTSWAKVKYIKSFCEEVTSGRLDLIKLQTLPDEELIKELTKVKGIGQWTAEMILIFDLCREDVFSLGDLGLRSAVAELYNIKREDLAKIEKISLAWSPHRSHASRLLWHYLDSKKKSK